jgi:hypothetical protein
VSEGEFDLLGYTFGRLYSTMTGQARMGMRPSKKSIRRMVDKIHTMTTLGGVARDQGAGWQVKLHAERLGELLQGRSRQTRVSGARQLHCVQPFDIDKLSRTVEIGHLQLQGRSSRMLFFRCAVDQSPTSNSAEP